MIQVGWEPVGNGKFWVVQHDGMLKTGPFRTQEQAVEWFRKELDEEISIQGECDGDQKTNESGTTEEATDAQASQSHTSEESSRGTETWVSHCPGCVSADS